MKKLKFEVILLTLFVSIFLFLAISEPWGHKISHPFPYSYLASDAFFHQSVAQYMAEQGYVTNTPPYIVGGYKDVVDMHPPILFQLTGGFSTLSGLNVHDNIMFTAVLCFVLAILMLYLIWRKSSKAIAMLALPAGLLMLQSRLLPLIFWGYWLLLAGILFMVASLWAISRFEEKKSWILISLFLSATALAHQPEFVYAGLFLAGWFVIKIIKERKISKEITTKALSIAVPVIILTFYSLIVFTKSFIKSEGYRNAWDMKLAVGGYPVFNLVNLGIFGIVALAGIILFIISKKSKLAAPAAVSIFAFLLGELIFLGIGKRAYAHRLFWIIYLSFFFGYGIYYIIKLITKNSSFPYPIIIAVILTLVFAQGVYGKTRMGSGIMDEYNWDALNWVAKNIPYDSPVYYFYSDALSNNAPIYNSRHVGFNIIGNAYFADIESQQLKSSYLFKMAKGYSTYLHKTGPLSFCYIDQTFKPKNNTFECLPSYARLIPVPEKDLQKNICEMEYAYFTKYTSQPVIAQYNMAIRDLLLKNNWTQEIYSNPLVSVIKNNKPGEDCLGKD